MRVLLTGSRAPATLELARRLYTAGHEVFTADSVRWDLAAASGSVTGNTRLPPLVESPREWLAQVNEIVRRQQIDYWVPTCEETFYAAGMRADAACPVLTSSLDVLDRLHNKWKFSQLEPLGDIRAPHTVQLSTADQWDDIQLSTRDWVLKPMYSRFAAETLIGPTRKQFIRCREQAVRTKRDDWIAQRRVVGRERCAFAVAHGGRLQAFVCYHSKYRAGKGAGIYFVPTEDPKIQTYTADLIAALDYTGMLGIDFMCSDDGRLWPIEANPRATSGIHQLLAEGDILEAFLGKRSDCLLADPRPRMVGFAVPLWGTVDACRQGRIGEFLIDIFRARDVVWQWRDPRPALVIGPAMVEFAMVARRRGISIHQATTWDFEWNGDGL